MRRTYIDTQGATLGCISTLANKDIRKFLCMKDITPALLEPSKFTEKRTPLKR